MKTPLLSRAGQHLLRHPAEFAGRTIRDFGRNQGLLLAGAIAYYGLLSLVPLMILSVLALSRLVAQQDLMSTLGHYLEWLVPSQSRAVLADVSAFLENPTAITFLLLITMLFFSSLAFSILQKAMAVIFAHRKAVVKRHALVSALLPYGFALLLCVALLAITVATVVLQTAAQESIHLLGRDWSLRGASGLLLYLLGLGAEIGTLTVLYLVLPVGRTRLRHALLGAATVTALWDVVRHLLIWYFTTLSKASVVYGSLTTSVVALFSMEIAATLFLIGAQVISEYEQLELRLST